MDNLENGSAGSLAAPKPRTRHRSRHKRTKASSVASRLNPDFDPKNAFLSPLEAAIENVSTDKQTPAINTIMRNLQPTIIEDYLQKLYFFLFSDKRKEMSFSYLGAYEKDFLVTICEDQNVFKSSVFSFARISEDIVDILEIKRNKFTWIHEAKEDVVVYKKIDNEEMADPNEESYSSPLQTLITNAKRLSITSASVPSAFKTQMLNTTLRFIKDPTQLCYVYPEMSLHEGEFLYSLFYQPNHESDVGFGFKSIYSSLFETMRQLRDKYDFEVSFRSNPDVSKVQLVLNKIPKSSEKKCERFSTIEKSIDLNSSNTSSTTPSPRKRSNKDLIIKSVPEPFIRSSLERMLAFLEDDQRASLEFRHVDLQESQFIECIPSLSKSENHYSMFSGESVVLLKRVGRCVRAHREEWSLRVGVTRLDKQSKHRTVTFSKAPVFGSKIRPPSANWRSESINVGGSDIKWQTSDINGPTSDMKGSTSDIKGPASEIKGPTSDIKGPTSDIKGPASEIKVPSPKAEFDNDNGKLRSRQNISFESAGSLMMDPMNFSAPTEIAPPVVAPPPLLPASRKGRLMQAFATPVASDRGERMMRLMGWEGGALGSRGEGIVEPLVPALHLSPGAGLGHVKASNPQSSVEEFRLHFLEQLLSFLHSQDDVSCVSFPQQITKREKNFMKHAVSVLNLRRKLGLDSPEELKLVRLITVEMVADKLLVIELQINKDWTKIKLTKTKDSTPKPQKHKTKAKSKGSESTHEDIIQVSNIAADIDSICPTHKAARNLAYRIAFLEGIKLFVVQRKTYSEFKFDCILNKKQINYIQTVVTNINKGFNRVMASEIERELYKDIRKNAVGCFLNVTFDKQSFLMFNKYGERRPINVSELPPPISKDLNQTIIYENNVAIPALDYRVAKCDTSDAINKSKNDNSDIVSVNDENVDLVTKEEENISVYDDDESLITTDYNVSTEAESISDFDLKDESVVRTDYNETKEEEEEEGCDLKDERLVATNHNESKKEDSISDYDLKYESLVTTDYNETKMEDSFKNHKEDEGSLDTADNASKETENDSDSDENNESLVKTDSNDSIYDNSNDKHELDAETQLDDSDSVCLDISDDSILLDVIEKEINNMSGGNVDLKIKDDCNEVNNNNKLKTETDQIRYVSLVFENQLNIEDTAKVIQEIISNAIDTKYFLPLLKCHGMHNGGLLYSCDNNNSYCWLKNVSIANGIQLIKADFCENVLKLSLTSFMKEDAAKVLDRLRIYNPVLNTKSWLILHEEISGNLINIKLIVDDKSYKFLKENGFSIYAGIDKAHFTQLWD